MENKGLEKEVENVLGELLDGDLLVQASEVINNLIAEIEDLEKALEQREQDIAALEDKLNNPEK